MSQSSGVIVMFPSDYNPLIKKANTKKIFLWKFKGDKHWSKIELKENVLYCTDYKGCKEIKCFDFHKCFDSQ